MADPQALHTELLELARPLIAGEKYSVARLAAPLAALTAVLELHKPEGCNWIACRNPEAHRVCSTCGPANNYPCETVRVIATALGVATDE